MPDPKPFSEIKRFLEALNAYEFSALAEVVTGTFKVLENGEIWNFSELLAAFESCQRERQTRRVRLVLVDEVLLGGVAVVTYYHEAEVIIGGSTTKKCWLESAVLIRDSNAWKLELLHSTP